MCEVLACITEISYVPVYNQTPDCFLLDTQVSVEFTKIPTTDTKINVDFQPSFIAFNNFCTGQTSPNITLCLLNCFNQSTLDSKNLPISSNCSLSYVKVDASGVLIQFL